MGKVVMFYREGPPEGRQGRTPALPVEPFGLGARDVDMDLPAVIELSKRRVAETGQRFRQGMRSMIDLRARRAKYEAARLKCRRVWEDTEKGA